MKPTLSMIVEKLQEMDIPEYWSDYCWSDGEYEVSVWAKKNKSGKVWIAEESILAKGGFNETMVQENERSSDY